MLKAANGIRNISAFNAENNVNRAGFYDPYHLFPIDDTISTSTSDWSSGHFSLFCTALGKTDIFSVKVNQPVLHMSQPFISIGGASQVTITRIIVYANGWRFHQ